jgi:hypothetical protein
MAPSRALAGLLGLAVLGAGERHETQVRLRPAEDLTYDCYDFPKAPFNRMNNVRLLHGSR